MKSIIRVASTAAAIFGLLFLISRQSRSLYIPNSELTFKIYLRGVRTVSLSPAATVFAVGTDDAVKIISTAKKEVMKSLPLPPSADQLATTRGLAFDPTGRWLVSCFSESAGKRIMRVWRTSDWNIVADIPDHGRGHGCRSFAFSRDGAHLIRVFGRPSGFEGPSISVYETEHWTEKRSVQTAPFYPSDVRVDPCTSIAWIIGEVRNPVKWSRLTPAPVFGNPAFPDSSALVSFDMAKGRIVDRMRLDFDIASRSSLSISPKCDSLAIHGIGAAARMNLAEKTFRVINYPSALDQPTYILHAFGGDVTLEGVNAITLGYLRATDETTSALLFELQTDAIAVDASIDGKTLLAAFEDRIELYKLNREK